MKKWYTKYVMGIEIGESPSLDTALYRRIEAAVDEAVMKLGWDCTYDPFSSRGADYFWVKYHGGGSFSLWESSAREYLLPVIEKVLGTKPAVSFLDESYEADYQ